MKYMRSEYFQGNGVTDSKSRHQWEQGGSLDARERARGIARKILKAPETPYISRKSTRPFEKNSTFCCKHDKENNHDHPGNFQRGPGL
jgi:trimethylamine:corrinoid methyltransferase-like protein